MNELALGIDIGGTNTVFGLCDENGTVQFEHSLPTKEHSSPEKLVEAIFKALEANNQLKNIAGIGIGAPNGNYNSGTIEFAPNLNWKGSVPLTELFERQFGVKTVLTNDANAAAIGEMMYGAAKDLKDFVVITLGTGLGSGIVANGKLIYGHDGFAGEFGHIRVVPGGRLCGCGRRGCLEQYASATGVTRSYNELESEHKATSSLNELDQITAIDVFQHAESGDQFAKEIVDFTVSILGKALADFACFSSPKAYILFGGIAQSGPLFADQVKAVMEEELLNIYRDKIDVRISELHGKNAAVLGAASLAWKELIH